MDPTRDGLCPGCFAHKDLANPCPHCGYDERAPRPPLLLPLRTLLLGQYLVGRVLGKPGGFGITYLGWDLALERRIAIKEFLPRELAGRAADHATVTPHSAEDDEVFRYGLGQFLREARTLAQLDHPNIVRVLQVFEANATAYLVMEYYEGLTLAEHLDRQGRPGGGRVPEETAKQLLRPVLDGLRAVHAKGFLHRDIKPQNIYLARTEGGGVRPILLDFGAARQAVGERTQSVSVLGTPGYAPFEQYNSRGQQGAWSDIYAAGAVLYRMVTGVAPPPSSDRMADDNLKPASAFGVSRAMSDTLASALAINPEVRPQTVQSFQAELWPVVAKPEPESEPPPRPVAPSRPAWPAWPWLLLVIGIGAAWFWHEQQQGDMERRHQDDLSYAAAQREDTLSAYRTYLGSCGGNGCNHHSEADSALTQLERERGTQSREGERKSRDDTSFRMATRMDSADAYLSYLDGCVEDGCGHRAEAQVALDRLNRSAEAARRAQDDTRRAEAERLTREQAEQGWARAAREQRDKEAYDAAARTNSEGAYRQYLGNCYENGCAYKSQAEGRLAEPGQRQREEDARQAEERRKQAPVVKVQTYFGHANAGQVDAALACLDKPRPSSRKILENLASVQLNELRLESSGIDTASVLLDWTGKTRDGKTERYRGPIPMVLRNGDWRIESFGQLKLVK